MEGAFLRVDGALRRRQQMGIRGVVAQLFLYSHQQGYNIVVDLFE